MNFKIEHFPALEVKAETKHYIDCPVCSNSQAFQIDYLLRGTGDVRGDNCEECGTCFRFTLDNGKVNLVTAPAVRVPILALLRYTGNLPNQQLFFVINTTIRLDKPGILNREADFETLRYWIDEHTCPTNIIPVECIISNGNDDLHGVVKLVDYVPIAELCTHYNITQKELLDSNNCYYQHHFQKHTGMDIDDECVYENVTIESESIESTETALKKLLGKDFTVTLRQPKTIDPAIRRNIESWMNFCGTPDPTLSQIQEGVILGQFIDQLLDEGYSVDKSNIAEEQMNWVVSPKQINPTEVTEPSTELTVVFSATATSPSKEVCEPGKESGRSTIYVFRE
jgi:hypothetical protein